MSGVYLSLIIPAYNESRGIATTLDRAIAALNALTSAWEILVVDDGSTDDTAAQVGRAAARDARVRLFRGLHAGKGAAVRRGMLAATGEGAGARRVGESLARYLIGRAFNRFVRTIALPGIRDTQCGYKLFSARAAQELFRALRCEGLAFAVELLFLARRRGFTIKEVPIVCHQQGDSRIRLRAGMGAVLQVVQIRLDAVMGRYRRDM